MLPDPMGRAPIPGADDLPESFWQATSLGCYVRERRLELALTQQQAAELSGLQLEDWLALELAWVPRSTKTIRAIAATLQVKWRELGTLAFFASLPGRN
jgi:transcriptional regulator with XRE-family HTH domain